MAAAFVLTFVVPAFVAVPSLGVVVYLTHVGDIDPEGCGDGGGNSLIRGGIKWMVFPVEYRLALGGTVFEQVMRDGFAVWDDLEHPSETTATAEGSFFVETTDPGEDVLVSFADIDGEGGVLARALVSYTLVGKEIVRAEVEFDSGDAWEAHEVGIAECDVGGAPYNINAVAVHEFGHVVGLDHSSKSTVLTMYPFYIGPKGQTLATGDLEGFARLYDGGGGEEDDGGNGGGGACPPGNPTHPRCS